MPRQSDVRFTFEAAGAAAFDVVSFQLEEGISRPFSLSIELSSSDSAIDFGTVLDQSATFTIWRGETAVRYVNGLVSRFEQGKTGFRRTYYHVVVEPQISRSDLRSDWRIFQQESTPQILQTVLRRSGINDAEQSLSKEHLVREYCVQPGETDFYFISRLCAEEGLFYTHRFSATAHRLVMGDRLYVHGAIEGGPVIYNATPGGDQAEPCITKFRYAERVRTARQVQRDYSFRNPRYSHEQASDGVNLEHQDRGYERYDYPSRAKRDEAGRPFTETRLLALRHDAQTAGIEGDDARLQPGLAFDLEGHVREDWNTGWRVVSMIHTGTQAVSQEEEAADADVGAQYGYTANVIPDHIEWKPELLPKPRIDGPLIATVTGPAGEEIHCDEHGRVTVQFPWDRYGSHDEHSSCWIRVTQNWAGTTWGHMAIPRIGQEVIVAFLDGDCDQPIIIGRTYHATNLPPYELPRHKTRMTIRSQTHKGEGYNELRFEDEKDQEEIFVHAQKDYNIHVNHDETTFVGNDRRENVEHDESIDVGHDRTESVGNDEQVSIGHNRTHSIGQDAILSIERNQTINIGKDRIEQVGNHRKDQTTANHIIDVGGHVEASVEGHHKLSAGQSIERQTQHYELKASQNVVIRGPGGTITIDAGGVTIEGIAIRLKGPMTQSSGAGNGLSFSGNPAAGEIVSCVEKNQ
ncbi:type VI secretion system Vgr family protein [Paraburkholderia tropica]|uniref:type VI secretion system Vgr family protein n=1 Tax=Paraburkholderia tropica TaxID=92647 RepID=UPI002ABE0ACC|nr:type VI secretion system tip protein TssI/VgrG [Paraburkholderia tropica]